MCIWDYDLHVVCLLGGRWERCPWFSTRCCNMTRVGPGGMFIRSGSPGRNPEEGSGLILPACFQAQALHTSIEVRPVRLKPTPGFGHVPPRSSECSLDQNPFIIIQPVLEGPGISLEVGRFGTRYGTCRREELDHFPWVYGPPGAEYRQALQDVHELPDIPGP